jgi:hypothetical protein
MTDNGFIHTTAQAKTAREAPASRQLALAFRDGLVDGWAIGRDETLADLVGSRTSGLGLFYVLLYITFWGRYRDRTGEAPPSNLALSTAMRVPNKTVDRYRRRFVEAFPELEDPGVLYDLVRPKVDDIAEDSPDVVAFKLGGALL